MLNADDGGQDSRQDPSSDAARSRKGRQSPIRSATAALLTDEQAAREVLGMSARKFADVMKAPWMPKPVVLGPRMRRWVRSELEAAILNAPRQDSPGGEPAQLRRAKIERMKARGQGQQRQPAQGAI